MLGFGPSLVLWVVGAEVPGPDEAGSGLVLARYREPTLTAYTQDLKAYLVPLWRGAGVERRSG